MVEEGAPIAGAAAEFVSRATPAQRRLLATVTPTFAGWVFALTVVMTNELRAAVAGPSGQAIIGRACCEFGSNVLM